MAEKILSNVEVIHLIQVLKRMEKEKISKEERTKIFNQIPGEFKVTICLGCGQPMVRDCGCPAGSAENLRSKDGIAGILKARET